MAFRQSNKAPNTAWRKQRRDELLQNGMPASVVDDERRWNYVILHGVDEFGSGWDPTWVSRDQAERLLTIIRSPYNNPVGLDLIPALEKRSDAQQKA